VGKKHGVTVMGRKHVRVRLKLALSLLWIFSLTIPASAQYETADDNSTVTILVTLVLIGVILFLLAERSLLKDEIKKFSASLTHREIPVPEGFQRCRITGNLLHNRTLRDLREMPYQEYLRTPEWIARRHEMLRRADNRCQLCNWNNRLEVHHRTYDRLGNEAPEDLTVLCRECHELFHRHRGMPVPQSSQRVDDLDEIPF